jgi:phenylalanyl-tRNA synthetase alpha subunit
MIDYKLLDSSIAFYKSFGFERIESPWAVSQSVINITKPKNIPDSFILNHNNKGLVASGEQSFLYLYLKGYLPKGRFQTITPCFRYDEYDSLHSKQFIKNELIITKFDLSNKSTIENIVDLAYKFFQKHGLTCDKVKTDDGFDLVYKGIEIGSYGYRECDFLSWVYGTGLAEPRFSNTRTKYGISS